MAGWDTVQKLLEPEDKNELKYRLISVTGGGKPFAL